MLKYIKKFLIIFFICWPCYVGAVTKTEQLHNLVNIIKSLKNFITKTHHKQFTLQQQLRHYEVSAGYMAITLKKTTHKLKTVQNQLHELYRKQASYKEQLAMQQLQLSHQLQAAYMLGKQPYFKLLLNNQDPSEFNRIFTYYYYLQQFRVKLISRINVILIQLQENAEKIRAKRKQLLQLQNKQRLQYKKFDTTRKQRADLLHVIDHKLTTKTQELTKLLADKKALEKIIAQLKASSVSAEFATPLGELHKKLHWPAKGKIDYLFGTNIGTSQVKWNSVIINAPLGENVYAISNGRVVFAGWLRGYGLLIIISHGHGYLSLYGRNGSLYKKVGDIVNAQELIATVGDSGGYTKSSLYFAIRHNGNPVDPKLWCK